MYLRAGSAGAAQPLKHAEKTCGKAFPESFHQFGLLESSSTESSLGCELESRYWLNAEAFGCPQENCVDPLTWTLPFMPFLTWPLLTYVTPPYVETLTWTLLTWTLLLGPSSVGG